jgi:xanthine/uracil permease
MNVMQFRYGLDERPPLRETILYGVQWFAVTIPIIIILGKITGSFHFSDVGAQMVYLQKLIFVMAAALLGQIFFGHRMPLIIGPSSILLIGIIVSAGHPADTVYSAIFYGGILLTALSMTGWLGYLRKLFPARVVAVVLFLIAFTLSPTILKLTLEDASGAGPLACFIFTFVFVLAMFAMQKFLSGIWKSTLIVWMMAAGTTVWFLMIPGSLRIENIAHAKPFALFFENLTSHFTADPGILVSFLICFVALFINDLGSIQSMNGLLQPDDPTGRINRGVFVTGLSNMASGLLGVIGPVNFSLSPGVITATSCASRFTMIPTALILMLLSCSPLAIAFIGNVPSIVIGGILIYVLTAQVAAGLMVAFEAAESFTPGDGFVIGLPLLLATVVAFQHPSTLQAYPAILRPILGNGFVVGVIAALILEHGLFRR